MNVCWIMLEATKLTSLNVAEVCRQTSKLRQVAFSGRRLVTSTPDELYERFSYIAVSLPDKSSSWSLQLCLSFLSALSADLSTRITSEKTFSMPDLTTLTTKSLQLQALRTVKTQACKSFSELSKEKEKITNLIRNLDTTQNRGISLNTSGFQYSSSHTLHD